jgi:hypothetical protein
MTELAAHVRVIEETSAYWRVLFENPPFNIVDATIFEGLQDLLARMDASPNLRVVVFESANPEFYLAHFDLTGKTGNIITAVGPDHDGKIAVLIVGVGGFLGVGEKDVAVPFNAVQFKTKDNNKWYPVMNTTKDALKNAPGYKYDRTAMTWMPENAPATTGTPATPSPRANAR